MSGKQHIASGIALAGIEHTGFLCVCESAVSDFSSRFLGHVSRFFDCGSILWIPVCVAAYGFGLLLPDIDRQTSILGRYIRLPVEHRKWFHTIYPVLFLIICALRFPILSYVALGYFNHLWMDDYSKCGICWFDPVNGYRKYPSGAKIKKKWHLVLYTNEVSGWILCSVLLTACFFIIWQNRFLFF